MPFGVPELLIVLVIVVVLFGVGRISKIAGEMGSGIRAFKEGMKSDEDEDGAKVVDAKVVDTETGETPNKS